jgi:hypothetical protein
VAIVRFSAGIATRRARAAAAVAALRAAAVVSHFSSGPKVTFDFGPALFRWVQPKLDAATDLAPAGVGEHWALFPCPIFA